MTTSGWPGPESYAPNLGHRPSLRRFVIADCPITMRYCVVRFCGNGFAWWIASRPLLAIRSLVAAVLVQTAVLTAPDQSETFGRADVNGRWRQKQPPQGR